MLKWSMAHLTANMTEPDADPACRTSPVKRPSLEDGGETAKNQDAWPPVPRREQAHRTRSTRRHPKWRAACCGWSCMSDPDLPRCGEGSNGALAMSTRIPRDWPSGLPPALEFGGPPEILACSGQAKCQLDSADSSPIRQAHRVRTVQSGQSGNSCTLAERLPGTFCILLID